MDVFSIVASAAGLVSLALELSKTCSSYADTASRAQEEIERLLEEAKLLHHVLQQLEDFLRNRANSTNDDSFSQALFLSTTIISCKSHIDVLLNKLKANKRDTKWKWPFKKDDCEKSVAVSQRYSHTFQFSIDVSNRLVKEDAQSPSFPIFCA
jgi:hypothetical protein